MMPMATERTTGILRPSLVSAIFFMVVTGLLYPLFTTGVASFIFPHQSAGSLITLKNKNIGSEVIGQYFTSPKYFHGRPSATSGVDPEDNTKTIPEPYNAAASAASNYGVLNKNLINSVGMRAKAYRNENMLNANSQVPVDAVTSSASGLDPHISLANAYLQIKRIAKARGISPEAIVKILNENTEERQFGILGEPRINVLKINLALDALKTQ